MNDIVYRLRSFVMGDHLYHPMICTEAADEIERLRGVVRQRTKLLDDQFGTPCEQIRHEQEIERLRTDLVDLLEFYERDVDWSFHKEGVTRRFRAVKQDD